MKYIAVDGVRYRVKKVHAKVDVSNSGVIDKTWDKLPVTEIHILEPIPFDAYKEEI